MKRLVLGRLSGYESVRHERIEKGDLQLAPNQTIISRCSLGCIPPLLRLCQFSGNSKRLAHSKNLLRSRYHHSNAQSRQETRQIKLGRPTLLLNHKRHCSRYRFHTPPSSHPRPRLGGLCMCCCTRCIRTIKMKRKKVGVRMRLLKWHTTHTYKDKGDNQVGRLP